MKKPTFEAIKISGLTFVIECVTFVLEKFAPQSYPPPSFFRVCFPQEPEKAGFKFPRSRGKEHLQETNKSELLS